MARDLQVVKQVGPARGVDESISPAEGTVQEAFNIDTSDGTWRVRGGFNPFILGQTFDSPTRLCAEYTPDYRYATSHFHALIVGGGAGASFSEYRGGSTISLVSGDHGQGAGREYTWTQGLSRYTVGDETHYTTALLITNGEDPPFTYDQEGAWSGGQGYLQPLVSYDPGDGISYLPAPPRGRFCFQYKSRFFMGNIAGEAGNRLYWTGPDGAQAFPMQVWPANYNADIGGLEDLTGGIVLGDSVLLFKNYAAWLLNGEGVGGAWSVRQISQAGEGAIGPRAICRVGNGVVFFNQLGAYYWSGGAIKTISHPKLQDTWSTLSWGRVQASSEVLAQDAYSDKVFQALHDVAAKRVFLSVSTNDANNDRMLVWNYARNSWDIWGAYWDSTADPTKHTATRFLSFGEEVKGLLADGPAVLFPVGGNQFCVYNKRQPNDSGSSCQNIAWKIRTHDLADSEELSMARNVSILGKRTGSYYLVGLVLRDGESFSSALASVSERVNTIKDAVTSVTHGVVGTSYFQTAASGPVDIWYVPQLALVYEARPIVAATLPGTIVFATTFNSACIDPGNYMILPTGEAPLLLQWMAPDDQYLWDVATWGNSFLKVGAERFTLGCNAVGRKLCIYLTNVGYNNGTLTFSTPGCSVVGQGGEIEGWELWVQPLMTRRGGQ